MNGHYTMYGIENRRSKIGNLSLNCNGNTTGSRRSQCALLFKLLPLNDKLPIFDYQFSILFFLGARGSSKFHELRMSELLKSLGGEG